MTDLKCQAHLVELTVTGAIGGLVLGTLLGETARFATIGTLVGVGLGMLQCTKPEQAAPSSTDEDEDEDEDAGPPALDAYQNKDGKTVWVPRGTVLFGDEVP